MELLRGRSGAYQSFLRSSRHFRCAAPFQGGIDPSPVGVDLPHRGDRGRPRRDARGDFDDGFTGRIHRRPGLGPDAGQSARLRVTVSYDTGGPAFESHRTWVYHNAAWIEADKERLPLTDFDALLQTDGSVQLEYRFSGLPRNKKLRFVYEAPTLLLDVPFDLAFEKVAVQKQGIDN